MHDFNYLSALRLFLVYVGSDSACREVFCYVEVFVSCEVNFVDFNIRYVFSDPL